MQGEKLIVGSRANPPQSMASPIFSACHLSSPRSHAQSYLRSPVTPPYAITEFQRTLYSPISHVSHPSAESLAIPTSVIDFPLSRRDGALAFAQPQYTPEKRASSSRAKRNTVGPKSRPQNWPTSTESSYCPARHGDTSRPQRRRNEGPIIADGTR